jgi:hypothetical protein
MREIAPAGSGVDEFVSTLEQPHDRLQRFLAAIEAA